MRVSIPRDPLGDTRDPKCALSRTSKLGGIVSFYIRDEQDPVQDQDSEPDMADFETTGSDQDFKND